MRGEKGIDHGRPQLFPIHGTQLARWGGDDRSKE